jgi:hypothetical protein
VRLNSRKTHRENSIVSTHASRLIDCCVRAQIPFARRA